MDDVTLMGRVAAHPYNEKQLGVAEKHSCCRHACLRVRTTLAAWQVTSSGSLLHAYLFNTILIYQSDTPGLQRTGADADLVASPRHWHTETAGAVG